ncbi:major facilitator superfamily MFS_1 domain protein [Candidatus Erwinia dacicola]|uniref:Major facilitator superfamily MFS_1 domain protein n=1 Tax=Candidatus Erwinia dacicola TaxID=252393 RepID=A0A328TLY3_9GAMM|nr:major facilitator superfamily MFS_1 domain protein [Candidatus Erwinia dacicola]
MQAACASRVTNPSRLVSALRLLTSLTQLFALGFWLGAEWLWWVAAWF